jgi:hypothetical protein
MGQDTRVVRTGKNLGAGLRYLDNKELQKVKDGVSGKLHFAHAQLVCAVFEFGIDQSRQGKVGCCQEVGRVEKDDHLASNDVLRGIDHG